jgi:hypothetical protein
VVDVIVSGSPEQAVTHGSHEDQSRIRAGHAAENFAVLRHIAFNLLRQHVTKRQSVKGRRLKAAWDRDYLLQVLKAV